MDSEKILARVLLLTDDPRGALLKRLSEDAAEALEKRLKPGVVPGEHEAALLGAAAADAVYRLALLDASLSPEKLTAGDVRAEYGANVQRAKELRDAYFRAASDVLLDGETVFRGVAYCG